MHNDRELQAYLLVQWKVGRRSAIRKHNLHNAPGRLLDGMLCEQHLGVQGLLRMRRSFVRYLLEWELLRGHSLRLHLREELS